MPDEMRSKSYHHTVSKSNQQIIETEAKLITLTQIYMTLHFSTLVQVSRVELVLGHKPPPLSEMMRSSPCFHMSVKFQPLHMTFL